MRGDTVLTDGRPRRRRHDGQDRVALPAARLRLPLVGDLRRPRVGLRLRALRRPAQAEHPRPLARGDGAGARRHRRARHGDHPPPARVGGVGPRRRIQRSARRLPDVQAALPRGPARAVAVRQEAEQAPRRAHRVRPDRAAAVQPDVRDDDRARAGVRREGLPPARDRAGHLRQLQERAPARPAASAVRDRQRRRQVVPQRDHARQLPLPDARVRADGDGVLRPARRLDGLVPLLGAGARRLVPALRPARVHAARPRAHRRGALALLERDERPRVPVPDRLVGARGGREPRRLRPQSAHRALRARSSNTSARTASATSPTSSSRP